MQLTCNSLFFLFSIVACFHFALLISLNCSRVDLLLLLFFIVNFYEPKILNIHFHFLCVCVRAYTHAWRNSLWFIVLAVLCIRVELNRSVRCGIVAFQRRFSLSVFVSGLPPPKFTIQFKRVIFHSAHAIKANIFQLNGVRVCLYLCKCPMSVDAPSEIRRKHHTPRHIVLALYAVEFSVFVFFFHFSPHFLYLSSYL